ncbi:hypothetical protein Vgi01_33560 [Micromonospora gifhornensis]|uniref:Uncharacterized protein n=1 Tax=Micromonospora gifhornensis TaxID=84594 RepID=A0ABQ4IFM6_9ACTN|nr:hypothetical protein Vgi01_33560 [Micromonospora gifhornensis]
MHSKGPLLTLTGADGPTRQRRPVGRPGGAAPEGDGRDPARDQVVAVQVSVGALALEPEARKPNVVLAPEPRLPL